MVYVPTDWSDGVTPVDEAHLDHLEGGLVTADANASAALAALPAKEDKANKGAANGYAPLDGTSKVPAANLPTPPGTDLSFDGDWVAGTYQDGDVVVKDGVLFQCVGGPTAVAPDASLWSAIAPVLPTPVNGKWLTVAGGAMLWSDLPAAAAPVLTNFTGNFNAAGANTDLALTDLTDAVNWLRITTGGGSVRAISTPANDGTVTFLQNASALPVTLLHNTAGGAGTSKLFSDAGANTILPPGATAVFLHAGSWFITGITQNVTQRVLNKDLTTRSFNNTTAENTISTYSIPANVMGPTGTLRLTLLGLWNSQSTSGNVFTFRIKLGATTIWQGDSNSFAGAGQPQGSLFLQIVIQNMTVTNAQWMSGIIGINRQTVSGGKVQGDVASSIGVISQSAIDTTAAQTLAVTCQMSSGNGSNVIAGTCSIVELL